MNANKEQIKLIHVAKSQLGMTDEEYREILKSYGATSSKDLSFEDANKLIESLKTMGFRNISKAGSSINRTKYSNLKNRPKKFATPRQLRMIDALWNEISDMKTEEAMLKFIKRITGKQHFEWLLKSDITKVKKALDEVKKRKQKNTNKEGLEENGNQ